jgi:hydrogenase maturation factor
MCLGAIARLEEAWQDGATRVGRLDDGCVVPLSFVPEARSGEYLLVHLGVPVEVLDAASAQDALALRTDGAARAGGLR